MSLLLILLVCVQAPATLGPSADDLATLTELVRDSRYEEAIELGSRLVEEARRDHGDGSEAEADAAQKLIEALYRGGHAMEDSTVELATNALSIKENLHGAESVELVPFLIQLGNLYIHRWENPQAQEQYARAARILEHAGATGDPAYAQALNNLGVTFKRAGEFASALESYEKALRIREETLGPKDPAVAASLNNIANVQVLLGDYEAAVATNERALSIREAQFGPKHEWVGESLNNLASVLGYQGEYIEALAVQERAVEVLEEALGHQHERTWAVRQNLGILYADMGDHRGAIAIYEPVLALMQERFGLEHAETVHALDALASSQMALAELDKAEQNFRESLRIREATDGADDFYSSYTLRGLGECLRKQGRFEEAAECVGRALAIWEMYVVPESPELSDLLHLLAELAMERGEYEEAVGLAARSARNIRGGIGGDHPLLAKALWLEARACLALGRDERALDLALEAETISRRHLVATMRVLSDAHALEYGSSRVSGLDVAMQVLDSGAADESSGRVFDELIRSRGVVLDEMAARRRTASSSADDEITQLLARSRNARSRLANLSLRGPGWEEIQAYRSMLLEAQTEIDTIDRELARRSNEFRTAHVARTQGLEEVQSTLGSHEALVAYVMHDDEDGEARYAAFVLVGHREYPRYVDLGSAETIDAAIGGWREQAAFGAASSTSSRGLVRRSQATGDQLEQYLVAASELRRLVRDPLDEELGACERLFLIPAGGLNLVAFPALATDTGEFLLESGPVVHRLPSERTLCGDAVGPASPAALVVGDPDFGNRGGESAESDSDCPSLEDLWFTPLPGAGAEAAAMVELWRTSQLPTPVHLAGEDATEERFKALAPGNAMIHVATHGFVLPPPCSEETGTGIRDNPLLRSGLAFSGANARLREPAGEDDGVLTSEEIAALDLADTHWAVLSACDSGVGDIRARGEGAFSLARSFQIAGARSVIMSLWAVDDEATREWMAELYDARVAEGMETGIAVQEASSRILARRRAAGESVHPHYWAAFAASGDWR